MRRYQKVVLGFLAILLIALQAQAATEIKIGVVSIQQALNEVEQGKKAKDQLKSEFDARQKKLDLQQDELKKIRDDLEKQRVVLSPEVMKTKEEEFTKKYMELQQNFANYRQEITQKEAQYTAVILENLRKICREIGQKEGYTLVVETSQDAVLYANSKEDLTKRVIAQYNKQYKGPLKTQ